MQAQHFLLQYSKGQTKKRTNTIPGRVLKLLVKRKIVTINTNLRFLWTNGKYERSTALIPCQHWLRRLRCVVSSRLSSECKQQQRSVSHPMHLFLGTLWLQHADLM
jgi:hypothetical protein